jgi:hypothetical protein
MVVSPLNWYTFHGIAKSFAAPASPLGEKFYGAGPHSLVCEAPPLIDATTLFTHILKHLTNPGASLHISSIHQSSLHKF